MKKAIVENNVRSLGAVVMILLLNVLGQAFRMKLKSKDFDF